MTLSVGDRLGRYEILGLLGAGGMGEVYRARDTELERDVAVKVLPETVAQDPDRLERFQREARAVAKLSHPNILEIFDFGHEGEVAYAVTELLEGESLCERLGSSCLGWQAAATIGADIAEGLAAAHERDVVHRDLKPDNLFLTADGRVKILDFGLARFVEESAPEAATEGLEETITKQGTVLGTAGYMSPEQMRGRTADRRSDIFSLGCVLYEMVAGRRAFKGDTRADTMAAVLTAQPEELSTLGAEVPADLEMAIKMCLHKTPASRHQSAADLAHLLRAMVSESSGKREARPVPVKKTPVRLISVVAAVVLALVAIALWMRPRNETPPGAAVSAEFDPNRVVVAVFDNRIGDPSFNDFGVHVADSIVSSLRQVDGLTVATNPFRSGAQGAGRQSEPAGADPLPRLAVATRSGLVVTGACYVRGDDVEIQARIVDPWQNEVRQAFDAVRATRSDISPAVETLSQQVAGTMARHFDNMIPLGLSRPVRLAAYQEFAGALDLWGIDRARSISRHKRALVIDSTFVLARSSLIRWYSAQGMVGNAEAELEVLEGQLPTLMPIDRLAVTSARARLEGRSMEALRCMREAVDLAPTSYWLLHSLGKLAIAVNRPREAVGALSRIPYEWPTGGTAFASTPHFELCFALHMLGDYEEQLQVAAESHELFPDRMVFYGLQGNALAAMGRFDELDHIVEESLTISVRGSSWGFSQTFTARELRAHGFRERSLELAERVVDWYRERPDEIHWSPEGPAWGYAAALNAAERWYEAREVVEQFAQDRPDEVQCLGLLGVLEARIGNEDGARRISEQLLASQDQHSFPERSYWRACIAAQLGQRDEAMGLLQRAFSEGLPFSDEFHRDINLEPLWDHPPFQELIEPKG